mmetsp:Transcript_5751/g.14624  ORF Transcript_5751/g.14624 Transcript_5751/m.14624 type:complete len:347 (-) Transcript_5751:440-1480(-)
MPARPPQRGTFARARHLQHSLCASCGQKTPLMFGRDSSQSMNLLMVDTRSAVSTNAKLLVIVGEPERAARGDGEHVDKDRGVRPCPEFPAAGRIERREHGAVGDVHGIDGVDDDRGDRRGERHTPTGRAVRSSDGNEPVLRGLLQRVAAVKNDVEMRAERDGSFGGALWLGERLPAHCARTGVDAVQRLVPELAQAERRVPDGQIVGERGEHERVVGLVKDERQARHGHVGPAVGTEVPSDGAGGAVERVELVQRGSVHERAVRMHDGRCVEVERHGGGRREVGEVPGQLAGTRSDRVKIGHPVAHIHELLVTAKRGRTRRVGCGQVVGPHLFASVRVQAKETFAE